MPEPANETSAASRAARYARMEHVRTLWFAWAGLLALVVGQGAWMVLRTTTGPEGLLPPGGTTQAAPPPVPSEPALLLYPDAMRDAVLMGRLGWLEVFIAEEGLDRDRASALRGLIQQHMIRMNDVRFNEASGSHAPSDSARFYGMERQRLRVGLGLLLVGDSASRFLTLLETQGFYPPGLAGEAAPGGAAP